MPLDIPEIRSDIQQLAYRYAVAVDSRDVAGLAQLFFPSDGSDVAAFHAATYRRFATNLARIGASFLNVGTHVISNITAADATGLVYCKAEFELGGVWSEQAILYRDHYVCAEGRWYFADRVHELWYGAPRGTDPLTLPPAHWPASQIGMGTVPATFGGWAAFWDAHPRQAPQ